MLLNEDAGCALDLMLMKLLNEVEEKIKDDKDVVLSVWLC